MLKYFNSSINACDALIVAEQRHHTQTPTHALKNMVWGKPRGIDDVVARLERNDASMESLYLMRHRKFEEKEAAELSRAIAKNTSLVELN